MTRPCLWAIGLGLLPTRFLLLIRIVSCESTPPLCRRAVSQAICPCVKLCFCAFCAFELAVASCTPLILELPL